jgi:sodium transport system permease protein
MLDEYERSIANKFDYNYGVNGDLVTVEAAASFSMSMMLPMLLMIFMMMGCLALAPESLAGEKERGTIATLLVTPIKRSDLAIGKIISLGILALLCGLSSAAGSILSLPKMMNLGDTNIGDAVAKLFGPIDILLLVFIILSTILLITTLMSIISTMAKSVKEATTAVMPLYIVVMLLSVTGMFGNGASDNQAVYFIPLYNTLQSMIGIFSGEYIHINVVLSIISNLVYAIAGSFILTKMFNSERVMFSK